MKDTPKVSLRGDDEKTREIRRVLSLMAGDDLAYSILEKLDTDRPTRYDDLIRMKLDSKTPESASAGQVAATIRKLREARAIDDRRSSPLSYTISETGAEAYKVYRALVGEFYLGHHDWSRADAAQEVRRFIRTGLREAA